MYNTANVSTGKDTTFYHFLNSNVYFWSMSIMLDGPTPPSGNKTTECNTLVTWEIR